MISLRAVAAPPGVPEVVAVAPSWPSAGADLPIPGFLIENPTGGLAQRGFSTWARDLVRRVDLCTTRKPGDGGPNKPSDIISTGLVGTMKCGVGGVPHCSGWSPETNKHTVTIGGRAPRPAWELANLGVGEPVMEGALERLKREKLRRWRDRGGKGRRPKLWVLELYCCIGANKPAAKRLGLGHVTIGGNAEQNGRFVPDVYADVALVFKEHADPLNFLIELATAHLGPGYDRSGLILVTAAPRCTTYSSMRHTNEARGAHTYRLPNGRPKPGRIGLPARVDDAANQRMFYFLGVLCKLIPQP